MDKIHMNYDAVFKDALTLFRDKTLDFLGLHDIPPITEPLSTEVTNIEVNKKILDLVFGLKDNSGLHIEEEVDLSNDDLLRFGSYHLNLCRVHKREFITVIFVKNPTKINKLNTRQLSFEPIIVQCSRYNADEILVKLKKAVASGEAINELELIYLPLFKSIYYTPTELFVESAKLIAKIQAVDTLKQKIGALLIALSNKIVDEAILEKYLEEVKQMGNVILDLFERVGEERGLKLGEERGFKIGVAIAEERRLREEAEMVLKMLSKGYNTPEILEITGISQERLNQIAGYEVA